ncbi:MAG: tRNA 2-thiouridine(34) synthase MnmA [Coriobacteriia bacterium]|nr:tRNA 2-thiouridine(34) synthase MnmA [Coriobacteriia bacterium]
MSGGVDSSVTALLMQRAGYDCMGVHMLLHGDVCPDIIPEQSEGSCMSPLKASCEILPPSSEAQAAANIARQLEIPFYKYDLRTRFSHQVIEPFIQGYASGETPNPCIVCNRQLKFGALLEIADELDCDVLATGHYACINYSENYSRWVVQSAVDSRKDQSYVLYTLSQEQLSRIKLPLGDYHKSEIRLLAADAGFSNAEKAESQDICFVPDGDYAGYIERTRVAGGQELPVPGDMLDVNGRAVGQHKGLIYYTIGQRKGLGAHGRPVFVQSIDAVANTVTIGDDEQGLLHTDFLVRDLNWIALPIAPTQPMKCHVKVGYKHAKHAGTIQCVQHQSAEYVQVCFDVAQRAITPGQAAVFFDSAGTVLGGGTIDRVLTDREDR